MSLSTRALLTELYGEDNWLLIQQDIEELFPSIGNKSDRNMDRFARMTMAQIYSVIRVCPDPARKTKLLSELQIVLQELLETRVEPSS